MCHKRKCMGTNNAYICCFVLLVPHKTKTAKIKSQNDIKAAAAAKSTNKTNNNNLHCNYKPVLKTENTN